MGRHGRFLGSDEERRHTHKRAETLYSHTCLHAMGSHCKLVCKLWSLKVRIIQKFKTVGTFAPPQSSGFVAGGPLTGEPPAPTMKKHKTGAPEGGQCKLARLHHGYTHRKRIRPLGTGFVLHGGHGPANWKTLTSIYARLIRAPIGGQRLIRVQGM